MHLTPQAHEHIHPHYDISALRHQALKDGMRPLRLAGTMKIAEGVTTIEEVLRSTPAWSEK
jgi:general secretion pathway protein E